MFSVGSNDHQALTDGSGEVVVTRDDPGWDDEYARRLAEVFDAFEGTDTTVVWVGHVRTEDPDVGADQPGDPPPGHRGGGRPPLGGGGRPG